MDNEYGTMFKRLMNERNELRKYIIDICKLLDIDTNQSVLGANCLEFYAVLCSTVNNKIKDLQQQLKRTGQKLQAKEQECETQRYKLNYYIKKTTQLLDDIDNYKQAFDEIEKIADKERKFDLRGRTPLAPIIIEVGSDFIDILDIINEVKGW